MEPLRPDDPRELGGYRLLRRLGEGGMGVVFLAVSDDSAGADLAAVKAIRPEYAGDREFRKRFVGEADLARRVRGPYTARVLKADTDGPQPWLATEYVPGPSLNDAVRDSGPFPEDSLLALAAGLAEALSAIHAVGLIHRDLKPSNVLLSPRGPQVIDFGIARAAEATAFTRTGQTLGTPAYMSPEQATGADLGPRSDLFAFGGVLLFAATGRPPFGTGAPSALLYRVVNERPDLSGVPETLLPLVTACLAKDPDDRPDLGSVAADLTGTVLPEGEDGEATVWLPEAVATRIQSTLVAVTRIAPTQALTKVDGLVGADPAAPLPTPDPDGARSSEPRAVAVAKPAEGPADRTDHRSTSVMGWGAAIAGVTLVIALAVALDSSEGAAPQAGADRSGLETGQNTAPPSSSPAATEAPSSARDWTVRDTSFLGGSDRFAVLSTAGVDVFEADRPDAAERLSDPNEGYVFSYSELASTPDGSTLAVQAVKSSRGGVASVHVWDLDESERHVVELPDGIGDSASSALSPDGETLFLGYGSEVSAYRIRTGEELYRLPTPQDERGREGFFAGLGTSADGELLIAVLDTGLATWDAASGEVHASYPEFRESPAEITDPVAFGDGLVATPAGDSVLLWDIFSDDDPTELRLRLADNDTYMPIRDVSLGAEGNRIVAVGSDTDREQSFLNVWDTEGEVLVEEHSVSDYSSVSVSPTDDRVLVAFHPLTGGEGREELRFVDADLETVQDFPVPGR
ncbi:WD40 repeat domain-containing serine/threonine protein kinase [Nocardiopsis sp. NPDC058631]|uniref:WD40 repeat domain-containing serine/threonine protein kinase n=1 Tax=Nocardiopsis sp. NPDC058631 TaxID=3346566 RepID=UPI003665C575